MNGIWEKAILAIMGLWVGSEELRLRNKVSKDHFNDVIVGFREQNTRLESHIWDIMQAQNIKPSIEPPDEIKYNHKET